MILINEGIAQKLLDAVATGAQNSDAFSLPTKATQLTWQTSFGVAPASITVQLQTSLDNLTWSTIDTSTSTSGEDRTIATSALFIRARINAISGGSAITVQLVCKTGFIGLTTPSLVTDGALVLFDGTTGSKLKELLFPGGTTTFLRADGTFATAGGGSGTPASPDTSIQFNNAGSFGGDANLLWNPNSDVNLNIISAKHVPINVVSTGGRYAFLGSVSGAANLNGIEVDQELTGVGQFGTSMTGYFALFTINAGIAADFVVAFDAEGFNNIGAGSTLTQYTAFRSELTSGATGTNIGLSIESLGSAGVNTYGVKIDTLSGSGIKRYLDFNAGSFYVDSNDNLVTDADVRAATYHVGNDAGIDATITTGSLVGKTITVKKGLITAFA